MYRSSVNVSLMVKKCNSNQKWNNNKCWCECKSSTKKVIFGILATFSCKNGKYVGSIIGDSEIICDEIIDTTKTIPTKSTSTKYVLRKCTSTNFNILLALLLITIALLIAFSIYCYLIKNQAKQKPLLCYQYTISKLSIKNVL